MLKVTSKNRRLQNMIRMTREEAIEFLKKNSPLPRDEELSDELIDQFDEARKFFLHSPDPVSIPLFLNAFGDGSGFGVYQLIEDVLTQFPTDLVTPHLLKSVMSPHCGVKFWSTEMVRSFPSKDLIPALLKNLSDNNSEVRASSATALASIGEKSVVPDLEMALNKEREEYVREDIASAIATLSK